jgi:hypothetical protein
LIALIKDARVVERILRSAGLPTERPDRHVPNVTVNSSRASRFTAIA